MNTMKKQGKDVTIKTSAIVAGFGLLVMAIIAPVANFQLLQGLIIPGNASETLKNIMDFENRFRLAIMFNLVVAILDIVVAWALYIFLKPVNKSLSLLAAWFRIIYAALFIAALFNLVTVVQLVNGTGFGSVPETGQLESRVMLLIDNYFAGWDFALIVFGFHLMLIGYLTLKAGYMKKILGILLIIASLGYLVDGIGKVLSPAYPIEIALYTFIGEVVLIFWLLIKGWKTGEAK